MGSIYVASNKIKKVYVGSTEIKKVYVGSTLIWSSFNGVSGSLSTFAAIKAAMQAGGWIYWTESNFPRTTTTTKTVTGSDGVTWTLTVAASEYYSQYRHTVVKGNTGMPGMIGASYSASSSSGTEHYCAPLGMAPADDGTVYIYCVTKYTYSDSYEYEIQKCSVDADGSGSSSSIFKP